MEGPVIAVNKSITSYHIITKVDDGSVKKKKKETTNEKEKKVNHQLSTLITYHRFAKNNICNN
jgi:hypothetical protein